ncbi:5-oxoprolinase subunit C family protein [Marinoscillum furvescens]|uniref:Biotin-dependent carboxylase-like uncharacterized protein n=1 Tax=Marinoscillum furvescens DSM 4134 TaxID=1122208 RepID=A0A3D9KVS0_MARFU|nr:biotin-dependent carboxyltransferase family protein [Marinoscillum furvescens]RED91747.1 biotin-dependent carboxylase-like uncharacterized protein [Marinoscillum furvescens DSM 4134]
MGQLIIQKPGLFTSIQDAGRYGYRRYGVPLSGMMDTYHGRLANMLVNNPTDSAVLEITQSGPTIQVIGATVAAISGADLSACLDDQPISLNSAFLIKSGQKLRFGAPRYGVRTYLAVRGGFRADVIMNSRSMFAPITSKNMLQAGDIIEFDDTRSTEAHHASVSSPESFFTTAELLATPGPEFDMLTTSMRNQLLKAVWTISSHNRMGYQLNAELSANHLSITTAPVTPGTVQLTPSGSLLVLARDAQVTGGYPRVLQLCEECQNQLAQKTSNQQVKITLQN